MIVFLRLFRELPGRASSQVRDFVRRTSVLPQTFGGLYMSEKWDDMRRAKEESYFDKKNREALERLKKKKDEEKPRLSPISGNPMLQEVLHGVVIDRCPDSGGVWLDAGELEELIEASKSEEGNSLLTFFKGLSGTK